MCLQPSTYSAVAVLVCLDEAAVGVAVTWLCREPSISMRALCFCFVIRSGSRLTKIRKERMGELLQVFSPISWLNDGPPEHEVLSA